MIPRLHAWARRRSPLIKFAAAVVLFASWVTSSMVQNRYKRAGDRLAAAEREYVQDMREYRTDQGIKRIQSIVERTDRRAAQPSDPFRDTMRSAHATVEDFRDISMRFSKLLSFFAELPDTSPPERARIDQFARDIAEAEEAWYPHMGTLLIASMGPAATRPAADPERIALLKAADDLRALRQAKYAALYDGLRKAEGDVKTWYGRQRAALDRHADRVDVIALAFYMLGSLLILYTLLLDAHKPAPPAPSPASDAAPATKS